MFICDPCLEKYYKNRRSEARHWEICEICKEVADCSEFHKVYLLRKGRKVSHDEVATHFIGEPWDPNEE